MNTKTLSPLALSTLDGYLHFQVGTAICSIPYFNNRVARSRGALRALVGKGSPHDITEEVQSMLVRSHISPDVLTAESLKRLLVEADIGVDCSAFAYHVLSAESVAAGKGRLDDHISFVNAHGILGAIRAKFRPAENCDVATFAHDKNSSRVAVRDVQPGDIITMIGSETTSSDLARNERDHILVIHQVEYQNFAPTKIHYSHAVAYPEDGVYSTGIRQGTIEIVDTNKLLTEQEWTEGGLTGDATHIYRKAKNSKTDLRRLI